MRKLITSKEESIEKMKRLMEFHFKPHTNDDSVDEIEFKEEPQSVNFKDIGNKYSAAGTVDSGMPTHSEYMEEVVNEVDPKQKLQTAPPTTPKVPQTAKSPETVAQPKEEPKAITEPPQVAIQPPQSQVVTIEPQESKDDEVKAILDKQISKTDELLTKIADLEAKLNSVDQVNQKIDKVEKELDAIKPTSYEEQLEMVSKNSFPFNVTLEDFWGEKGVTDEEPKEETHSISVKDAENYDNSSIAASFRPDVK